MTLLLAWIVAPATLVALAVGCGLVLRAAAGGRLPRALVPACGLATMIVVGQLLASTDATADLITPACVTLALGGWVLGGRSLGRPDPWALGAAAAVLAVFAAPIVLSGSATFAGYARLDDTATWMALTDRIMDHGRSLDGLVPSTYEVTLAFNLGDGYPMGAFLPLGVVHELTGLDVAWVIQPYMASLALILVAALWWLARPLVSSRPVRALAVALAAQPALLYGYYLSGAIKEMTAVALIAAGAGAIALAARRRSPPASVAAPAIVCAALAATLAGGGLIWLAPALLGGLALAIGAHGPRGTLARALILASAVVALSLPLLLAGGALPPTSSPLTSPDALGNLLEPLDAAQVAGIWPSGDPRLEPDAADATGVLVAIAALAAACGLVLAWRRRAWPALLFAGGTLLAGLVVYAAGSPWVDAKALAISSPAVMFAAAAAAGAMLTRGPWALGAALLAALAGGVLWSNALAYHDVNLAPRERLGELERIGPSIAGEGPTLLSEYEPYGTRHFLRAADPESPSELRRRRIPLRGGRLLERGRTADTDALDPGDLLLYRTLVVRRSPAGSRPPSPYRLVAGGDHYEVWQRRAGAIPPSLVHLGLGRARASAAVPACERVRRLARKPGPGGHLLAAPPPPAIQVRLSRARYPDAWAGTGPRPIPVDGGALRAGFRVPTPARYVVWLRGSVRSAATLLVDGREAGEVRHALERPGEYARLGEVRLARGAHRVELRFAGADLHPGSGGPPGAIGPLALSRAARAPARLVRVEPDDARVLCGHRWDWIEAIG